LVKIISKTHVVAMIICPHGQDKSYHGCFAAQKVTEWIYTGK